MGGEQGVRPGSRYAYGSRHAPLAVPPQKKSLLHMSLVAGINFEFESAALQMPTIECYVEGMFPIPSLTGYTTCSNVRATTSGVPSGRPRDGLNLFWRTANA